MVAGQARRGAPTLDEMRLREAQERAPRTQGLAAFALQQRLRLVDADPARREVAHHLVGF